MSALFEKLGVDLWLLLSQAFNFFILLSVLTFFVYKPLIRVIKERSEKIETGLEKAEEADIRLKEIDNIGKEKIKEAEHKGIEIIKTAEGKAKILERELQKKAEEKQKEMQKQAEAQLKRQLEENKKIVLAQANELVKKTIVKTIELKPDAADDALIRKAVKSLENE